MNVTKANGVGGIGDFEKESEYLQWDVLLDYPLFAIYAIYAVIRMQTNNRRLTAHIWFIGPFINIQSILPRRISRDQNTETQLVCQLCLLWANKSACLIGMISMK